MTELKFFIHQHFQNGSNREKISKTIQILFETLKFDLFFFENPQDDRFPESFIYKI